MMSTTPLPLFAPPPAVAPAPAAVTVPSAAPAPDVQSAPPPVSKTEDPLALHPALWRASQLARSSDQCIDTGHRILSQQLPGGGWPTGNLIDLLVQQAGIGEMRLLAPALRSASGVGQGQVERRIVLLQPPHPPQALALAAMGLAPSQLVWIKSQSSADALWAAEQVLKSGSCGALLFWAAHIRSDSLRRLHLAAQSGSTLFLMLRPLASAQDSSPAPLRLALRPAAGGIEIDFVKRRGPQRDAPLFLPLPAVGAPGARRQRVQRPQEHTVPLAPAGQPVTAALDAAPGRAGQLVGH